MTSLLYAMVLLWLAAYSIHSLYLFWLNHRSSGSRVTPPDPIEWPSITVQLPVYNELTTVERLLNAVAALDYPPRRLQIQVLDDSTDDTTVLLSRLVSHWQSAGLDISLLHRTNRHGFKAGALAEGLRSASGEYVALLDADFIPLPDFLKRCLPWFADPQVGCVQARWGHLNREYSLLTRLQAIAIDAHFMVEQTARSRHGLLMNFNGSAGIWRRSCISDAGGWQPGTLTEDFDLSYRAQLRGWRIEYLPDVIVSAELPVQMAAYKQQQARWARGSLQTARKLLAPLLASPFPLPVKIAGILHLTHYLVHPLMLAALLLSLWMRFYPVDLIPWLPWLALTALIPPLLALTAAAPEAPAWRKQLKLIPFLVLLGIGLSVNNTQAALLGLFARREGNFVRTPKYAVEQSLGRWESSKYAFNQNLTGILGEVLFILLTLAGMLLALWQNDLYMLPWLLLYCSGYGLVAGITLRQSIQQAGLRWQESLPPTNAQAFRDVSEPGQHALAD